jgi:hypothetical protein
VRKHVREEIILASALLAPAVMALLSARGASRIGFAATALVVAVGAASGRVGFDSILQRDAPDAVRGRSFARFETRFQLIWVVGALLGLLPLDASIGMLGLAAVLGFAGVSYLLGMRAGQARVDRNRRRSERARAVVRTGLRGALARFRRRRSDERPQRPRSEVRR